MQRWEVQLILTAKKEGRVQSVETFRGKASVRARSVDNVQPTAELAARCDSSDRRTRRIESEDVDRALLGIVQLKALEPLRILAGLSRGIPILGVSAMARSKIRDNGGSLMISPVDEPPQLPFRPLEQNEPAMACWSRPRGSGT